MKMALNRIW